MKKTFALTLIIAVSFLYSCSDNKSTEEPAAVTPAQEMVTDGALPTTTEPVSSTESQGTEIQMTPQPAAGTMTPSQPAAQPAATMEGMNPPHGQPNHRCDIAVGAPLSSPAGTGNAAPQPQVIESTPGTTKLPTAESRVTSEKVIFQSDPNAPAPGNISATPAPQPAPGPAGPVVTAPGMNPPHGEPGHDCAVAVGAPLPKK